MPTARSRYVRIYGRLKGHGHRFFEGADSHTPLPFTLEDLRVLINNALDAKYCYHCGDDLRLKNLSVDHKVALSMGGKSTLDNLRPICWPCNKAKRDMLEIKFHLSVVKVRLRRAKERLAVCRLLDSPPTP